MIKLTEEEEFTLKLITPHVTWDEFMKDFIGNDLTNGYWSFVKDIVIEGRFFQKGQMFCYDESLQGRNIDRIVVYE